MEESVASLFDSCDKLKLGEVSVSMLVSAVKDEPHSSDGDPQWQEQAQEILEAINNMLDPLRADVKIDKATWVAAWRKQKETHTNSQGSLWDTGRDVADSDDFRSMTSSSDAGALNQSKQSYDFSPSSHSSSLSTTEELAELEVLRKENRQLHASEKALRDLYLAQDETLAQEQAERQDQEKRLKNDILKLTNKCNKLQDLNDDLKSSLDTCEEEKLVLHDSLSLRNEEEKKFKFKIVALKKEVDELNRTKDNYESQIKLLTAEKSQLICSYSDQLKELQEKYENCVAEQNNNMFSQVTKNNKCVYPDKTDQQCGDYELNNNLQSELRFSVVSTNHPPSVDWPKLDDTYSLSESYPLLASTPGSPREPISIFEEINSVCSSFQNDTTLDCSFDMVQDPQAHGDNQLVGVTQDLGGFVTFRKQTKSMRGEYSRCYSDLKSDDLETLPAHRPHSRGTDAESLNSCSLNQSRFTKSLGDLRSLDACFKNCTRGVDQSPKTPHQQTAVMLNSEELESDASLGQAFAESQQMKNQYVHTRIQVLNVGTQTENQRKTLPMSFDSPVKPTKRITKTDLETSFPMSITAALQNSSPNFKILEKTFKNHIPTQSSYPQNSVAQSINTSVSSSFFCSPKWSLFHILFLIGINIALLLCFTTILTAAILEEARESGVFNPPYHGSINPWLKYLVKPFIKLRHGKQNDRPF